MSPSTPNKNSLLKWNTFLWLAAMLLPIILSFAFASTKFPWQIIVPFLLLGPMLGSNRMIIQAANATPHAANSE